MMFQKQVFFLLLLKMFFLEFGSSTSENLLSTKRRNDTPRLTSARQMAQCLLGEP